MKRKSYKKVAVGGESLKVTTTVETPEAGDIPEFEKPLVQLSISNPFKKLLYWLDQIRKKQTTTLAIKLSIPLIAFPIILAAAFSLGRISGLGFIGSGVGKDSPIPSPKIEISQQTKISKAGTLRIAKSATKTTYLLALRNGELMSLEIPEAINLAKYGNKQILVSGTLDKNTNVLRVADIAEVTIYNSLQIPEATEEAVSSE